jgi:hypothetical protein
MKQLHLPNGRRSEFLEGKKKQGSKASKKTRYKTLKITTNNFKSQHPQREKKKKKKKKEDTIIKFPRLGRSTWHRSMGEEVHRETSNPQNPSSLVSAFLRVPVVAIIVLVLVLLPQRLSESNLPLTSKLSSASSLSKFASSSQPILLLLLLYNRICKKPNHEALLLILLL